MAIIVSKKGTPTRVVEQAAFGKENNLQAYIYDHPEVVPVYEIEPGKHLFIAAREFETGSGPIDALAFDKDGDIYLIETKLDANADKRRVVAQVLDYGASLWKHSNDPAKLISDLDLFTQEKWGCGFQQKAQQVFNFDDEACKTFLDAIRENLEDGALKFVVLMDLLDERLKDLLTYINQKSQFTIYGVELELYKHDEYEIVIPKMFGVEVKKDVPAGGAKRRKWDENSFLAQARNTLEPTYFEALKSLYDSSKAVADDINWGAGQIGSFGLIKQQICTRSLFLLSANGYLQIPFGWVNGSAEADHARDELKRRLEADLGFSFPSDFQKRYPAFHVKDWYRKVEALQAVVAEIVGGKATSAHA